MELHIAIEEFVVQDRSSGDLHIMQYDKRTGDFRRGDKRRLATAVVWHERKNNTSMWTARCHIGLFHTKRQCTHMCVVPHALASDFKQNVAQWAWDGQGCKDGNAHAALWNGVWSACWLVAFFSRNVGGGGIASLVFVVAVWSRCLVAA